MSQKSKVNKEPVKKQVEEIKDTTVEVVKVEEIKTPLTYLNIEPTVSEFYMYPKGTISAKRNIVSPRFILKPRELNGVSIKVEVKEDGAYATLKGFGDVVTSVISNICSITSKPKYEVIK